MRAVVDCVLSVGTTVRVAEQQQHAGVQAKCHSVAVDGNNPTTVHPLGFWTVILGVCSVVLGPHGGDVYLVALRYALAASRGVRLFHR